MGVLWILLGVLAFHLTALKADDIVVGCGGFVKSEVEINYSLIEVRSWPGVVSGFAGRIPDLCLVGLNEAHYIIYLV
uniref:Uncharacterized protein n=1 Tax=Anguilla anguilla TaxID=7936 RepID=A0A0E9VVW7_ANGAN